MAKRAAPSSPETGQSNKGHSGLKKFKAEIQSPPSHESEPSGLPINDADDTGSWTKVEKRKAKKARKTETKLDVSLNLSTYAAY